MKRQESRTWWHLPFNPAEFDRAFEHIADRFHEMALIENQAVSADRSRGQITLKYTVEQGSEERAFAALDSLEDVVRYKIKTGQYRSLEERAADARAARSKVVSLEKVRDHLRSSPDSHDRGAVVLLIDEVERLQAEVDSLESQIHDDDGLISRMVDAEAEAERLRAEVVSSCVEVAEARAEVATAKSDALDEAACGNLLEREDVAGARKWFDSEESEAQGFAEAANDWASLYRSEKLRSEVRIQKAQVAAWDEGYQAACEDHRNFPGCGAADAHGHNNANPYKDGA